MVQGTPSAAALSVVNITSDHNKIGQLKQELFNLSLQKYAINEFLSSHSQAVRALASLRSQGITEERLIQLNNILDNNGYKLVQRKHMLPPNRNVGGSIEPLI